MHCLRTITACEKKSEKVDEYTLLLSDQTTRMLAPYRASEFAPSWTMPVMSRFPVLVKSPLRAEVPALHVLEQHNMK